MLVVSPTITFNNAQEQEIGVKINVVNLPHLRNYGSYKTNIHLISFKQI